MLRFIAGVTLMGLLIVGIFAVVNALIWVGNLFPIPSTILSLLVVGGGLILVLNEILKGK